MRVQVFTQLQAIDQRLAQLVRERDALLIQFEERDALTALRESRRALTSALRQDRGQNSDLQWELEDVELRLRALDEQERDGPTDPLVARELVLLRERRALLEEQVLALLEQIGQLEQQLVAVEQALTEARTAWANREAQLNAEIERLGAELETLQTERQTIAGKLPAGALELYDDLQRRHRGTALAPIRHRQCGVCRARLPAAVFDLLNTPDPLVRCPRCGRVLYLIDDDE